MGLFSKARAAILVLVVCSPAGSAHARGPAKHKSADAGANAPGSPDVRSSTVGKREGPAPTAAPARVAAKPAPVAKPAPSAKPAPAPAAKPAPVAKPAPAAKPAPSAPRASPTPAAVLPAASTRLIVPTKPVAALRSSLGGEGTAPQGSASPTLAARSIDATTPTACPADMVAIAGRTCIDRFEAMLVDGANGSPLSPYYPPNADLAVDLFAAFEERRAKAAPESLGALLGLPPPTSFAAPPRAVSLRSVVPAGYMSAETAAMACEQAGKRLCREDEWVTACRGEDRTQFPYGPRYEAGTCNVYRMAHPGFELHRTSSSFHRDPRLNLVEDASGPLLRTTGSTETCASRWGDDAVFDMVGNLDEWVSSPGGVFRGGFYSRGTKSGCDAKVSNHAPTYFDYSTGFRCCMTPPETDT